MNKVKYVVAFICATWGASHSGFPWVGAAVFFGIVLIVYLLKK